MGGMAKKDQFATQSNGRVVENTPSLEESVVNSAPGRLQECNFEGSGRSRLSVFWDILARCG